MSSSRYGSRRNQHSFPTRRSSDLVDEKTATERSLAPGTTVDVTVPGAAPRQLSVVATYRGADLVGSYLLDDDAYRTLVRSRSEEHTSELQSQFHLVCRLLLEKKKQ